MVVRRVGQDLVQRLGVASTDPAPDRPFEMRGRTRSSHAIGRQVGDTTHRVGPGDLVAGCVLGRARKMTLVLVVGGGGRRLTRKVILFLVVGVDFGFNVGLESSLGIFSVSIGTGT